MYVRKTVAFLPTPLFFLFPPHTRDPYAAPRNNTGIPPLTHPFREKSPHFNLGVFCQLSQHQLLHEDHAFRRCEIIGRDPAEVHTTGHLRSIPGDRVVSSLLNVIHERRYLLTEKIENHEGDVQR